MELQYQQNSNNAFDIINESNFEVCSIIFDEGELEKDEAMEYAKLFSASPQLLEALKTCLETLKAITIIRGHQFAINAAENAIEKATK